jgi:hypothetical protein
MRPVTMVRLGLAAEVIGIVALALAISATASWAHVVLPLAVYGIGVGLATAQLTGVVLHDVPVHRSGEGSGVQSTSRQIGAALGIAILGTILFTSAGSRLDAALADRGVPAAARTGVVDAVVDSAGGAIPGLAADPATAAVAPAAKEAFTDGTRSAAFAAAGFLALGLLATFSLGGRREDEHASAATPPVAAAGD